MHKCMECAELAKLSRRQLTAVSVYDYEKGEAGSYLKNSVRGGCKKQCGCANCGCAVLR